MSAAIWVTLNIMGYICLVAAPVIFIEKVRAHLREKENTHPIHPFPIGTHLIMNQHPEEEQLDIEDSRIISFNRVIDSCSSKEATRIWTVKKAEYVRGLKWLNLVESAQGSERMYNE